MKIISSLKNKEMIEQIIPFVDGITLGCQFSAYSDNSYSVQEIKDIYQILSKNNKKTFILLNFIMHENDIDDVRNFINEFENEEVYFIFQDLGILRILLSLNKTKYGVYYPLTMITNYRDLKEYEMFSLDAVSLSNEIPLKDVELCSNYCKDIFYLGFGYHPMYQTYRYLLSLYKEHSGLDFTNDNLMLQEATRENDRCPIIENKYGTIVFRNGVISNLEKIELLENVKYLYLDSIFVDENKYLTVLETYFNVVNNLISKEEGVKVISSLNLTINNQFMDVDSVYNPKEFE